MGQYTRYTREWLDGRYRRMTPDGVYFAHQPIYGRGLEGSSEWGHLWRLARQYQILNLARGFGFSSMLDVGGSEGFTCHLARSLFGCSVKNADLATEACKRSWDLFEVPGVACDSCRLPFRDRSFDLVVCTEVLEHVEYPVETLLELERVTRGVLILTTDEVRLSREAVDAHRHTFQPHEERNLFHIDDFAAILGPSVQVFSQFKGTPPADDVTDEEAAAWIRSSLADPQVLEGVGICLALVVDQNARLDTPRVTEEELMETLLRPQVAPAPLARRPVDVEAAIANAVCPVTHQPLAHSNGSLVTPDGDQRWPLDEGIPCLRTDDYDPDPGQLEQRMVAAWPEEPERAQAVSGIRERLAAPEPREQLSWDFSRERDRESWVLSENLNVVEGATDRLALVASGSEYMLLSPPMIYPCQGVQALEVTARFDLDGDDSLEDSARAYWMFWLDAEHPGFNQDHSLGFPISNDAQIHTYTVSIPPSPVPDDYTRAILVRLDPASKPGRIDLFSIRFVPA